MNPKVVFIGVFIFWACGNAGHRGSDNVQVQDTYNENILEGVDANEVSVDLDETCDVATDTIIPDNTRSDFRDPGIDDESMVHGRDVEEEQEFSDTVPKHCKDDWDCSWGSRCDKDTQQDHGCVYTDECPCKDPHYGCVEGEHWYECVLGAYDCWTAADCNYGEDCKMGPAGRRICVEADECTADDQCPQGMICGLGKYWKVCKQPMDECKKDEDCGYNFACRPSHEGLRCEWKTQCLHDWECPFVQTCQRVGNWSECRIGKQPCSSNDNCAPIHYCKRILGIFGSCETLDQCGTRKDCQKKLHSSNAFCRYKDDGHTECEKENGKEAK